MVESIGCELEKKFDKMSSVCHGPDYDFLRMKLKFMNRKVRVAMRDYLRKSVDMFGEPNLNPVMSPSKNVLLYTDPNSPKVKETTRKLFHSIFMLLMHLSRRGRRDLQLAMTFCPEG